jgi:dolichyl-phosphate beta-glucosyltransferase
MTKSVSVLLPSSPPTTQLSRNMPVTRADGRETGEIVWSVVIPAYNEAKRLPPYLYDVVAYFEHRHEPFEVMVVDDGSVDGTGNLVREIAASLPSVQVHVLPQNRGKGHAVRVGMLRAGGRFRLMADADGATPISETSRLAAAITGGADVAVGSRALEDDSVTRHTLAHRRISGNVFNRIVRALGVKDITDTQCGFKLFRGEVADYLFSRMHTEGFGFDVELLLLAQKKGYKTFEVAVSWADQPGSKVHVATDGAEMLRQVIVARWRMRTQAN